MRIIECIRGYSFLTVKKVSDQEYLDVLNLYMFEMKTVDDYHHLYIRFDVIFLAVVS